MKYKINEMAPYAPYGPILKIWTYKGILSGNLDCYLINAKLIIPIDVPEQANQW